MEGEWGPWIDHDGKGCPLPVGTVVEGRFEWKVGHFVHEIYVLTDKTPSWDWRNWGRPYGDGRLVMALRRYRVRKPRALLDLIDLVENLPAPAGPKVPA